MHHDKLKKRSSKDSTGTESNQNSQIHFDPSCDSEQSTQSEPQLRELSEVGPASSIGTHTEQATTRIPRWKKQQHMTSSSPHSLDKSIPVQECSHKQDFCDVPTRQPQTRDSLIKSGEETEERFVTQNDINTMAAKLMRAELSNNKIKIAKLKAGLDKLRLAMQRHVKVRLTRIAPHKPDSQADSSRRVAILTRRDDKGAEVPASLDRTVTEGDDSETLNDLVRAERLTSSRDSNLEFSRQMAKTSCDTEQEYESNFVVKKKKRPAGNQDAVTCYKRRVFAESSCQTCIERVAKHLIISVGQKKALTEFGSEWDQNRKLVRLKRPGFGAFGCIPPKFGYIAIEFGFSSDGIARVLDSDISPFFGREIIGGILDLEPKFWRKPETQNFDQLRKKIVAFEQSWKPFDLQSESGKKFDTNQSSNIPPEGPALPPHLVK